MRRLAPGLAVFRRPALALPVNQVRRRGRGHAFPPDVAIIGQGHIGENDVFLQRGQGIEIGFLRGAGGDAEKAGFRVDRIQPSVIARLDPGNVVTDRRHFPARKTFGRDQHGEIGFAAGRRERGGNIGFLSPRRLDAEDQHVLGQPALVTRHGRGDAQGKTLLAEQRIAAIARTKGPDFARFREMTDVFCFVARPFDVLLACFERVADAVQAGHELAVAAELVEHGTTHAGHDPHVDHDIGAVGNLDADMGDGRADRSHRERNHVHGAATHATLEQAAQSVLHLCRSFPVVVGAGIFRMGGADVGAVFDAGDIRRVRAGQVGVGTLGWIELDQVAGFDHLGEQPVGFCLRAIAPDDGIGLGQGGDFIDPGFEAGMLDVGWCVHCSESPLM